MPSLHSLICYWGLASEMRQGVSMLMACQRKLVHGTQSEFLWRIPGRLSGDVGETLEHYFHLEAQKTPRFVLFLSRALLDGIVSYQEYGNLWLSIKATSQVCMYQLRV